MSMVLQADAAVPAGRVAAAVVAFRYRGALQVTAVAKATFALVPDAACARTEPLRIIRGEVHHGNTPLQTVRFTSDTAPYLTHADVVVTGHVRAPGGVPASTVRARFGLFAGQRAVLDKSVIARRKSGFREIPLMYERAYGGAGFPANPFGIGVLAEASEPELVDPIDARRVAGFGPIGRDWPDRRRLLGALPRKALSEEIVDLPDDFDFDYFQCAPSDQRVDYLGGDEWIVTDNLHPTAARFSSRLPGAAGIARIYGLAAWDIPEGQLLEMHADLLRVDMDDLLATLTFRGTFPLPSEAALAHVRVVAGIEQVGEPIAWPGLPTEFESAPTEVAPTLADLATSLVPSSTLSGTMVVDKDQDKDDAREPAFARTADPLSSAGRSALPFVAGPVGSTFGTTSEIDLPGRAPVTRDEPATLEDTNDHESAAPDLPFLPPMTQRSHDPLRAPPLVATPVASAAAPSTPPTPDDAPEHAPPPSSVADPKKRLYGRFGGKT